MSADQTLLESLQQFYAENRSNRDLPIEVEGDLLVVDYEFAEPNWDTIYKQLAEHHLQQHGVKLVRGKPRYSQKHKGLLTCKSIKCEYNGRYENTRLVDVVFFWHLTNVLSMTGTFLVFFRNTSTYEKVDPEYGRRENTRTKKIGCSAQLTLQRQFNDDGEPGPWRVVTLNTTHNHSGVADKRLAKCNSLSPEEDQFLFEHSQLGVRANALASILQSRSENQVLLQTILNSLNKSRRDKKDGRSDLETLLAQLKSRDYNVEVWFPHGTQAPSTCLL
jgi:hypothetical protein